MIWWRMHPAVFLIEPENSAAIADAAVRLAELPKEELQKMGGARGKAYILEHHEYGVFGKTVPGCLSMPRRENK